MRTNYTIKNFRVFDEDGAQVRINPITILTGCNSSGKSSIARSLILLSDYLTQIKEDKKNGKPVSLSSHILDFTKKPNNLLGNFTKVVNRDSENKELSFELSVHSKMLGETVNVELVFGMEETDGLNNGILQSIKIIRQDGCVLFSSSKNSGKNSGNFAAIKDNFYRFLYAQHIITNYQKCMSSYITGIEKDSVTKEDMEKSSTELKNFYQGFKEAYGVTSWIDIVSRQNRLNNRDSFIEKEKVSVNAVQKSANSGIIYYLPIFDEMSSLEKSEVCNRIQLMAEGKNLPEEELYCISRLIDDFKSSDYIDLCSYFKHFEDSFLKNPVLNGGFGVRQDKSPRLFSKYDFNLNCGLFYEILDSFVVGEEETKTIEEKRQEEKERQRNYPIDFSLIYTLLSDLCDYTEESTRVFQTPHDYMPGYTNKMAQLFATYIATTMEEIFTDEISSEMSYISSSIVTIKRLYPLEADDEFTGLIKKYYEVVRNLESSNGYQPNTFFNKWIKAFGIGDSISMNVHAEGLGVTLRLHKSHEDGNGILLADNGFGITQLFAIMLRIEIAILQQSSIKVMNNPADPNIPSLMNQNLTKDEFSELTVAIEEPEIHLHPRYQSILAEMFYDAYANYNVHFIIETHSEYLIRKFQTLVGAKKLFKEDLSIMYVYDADPAKRPMYESQILSIDLNEDGTLTQPFGSGFFDEADSLVSDLFDIKMKTNGEA